MQKGVIVKEARKKALIEAFKLRIYIKRAGKEYESFHREVNNSYIVKCREYPVDIVKANR